jgi:hypothetical protein
VGDVESGCVDVAEIGDWGGEILRRGEVEFARLLERVREIGARDGAVLSGERTALTTVPPACMIASRASASSEAPTWPARASSSTTPAWGCSRGAEPRQFPQKRFDDGTGTQGELVEDMRCCRVLRVTVNAPPGQRTSGCRNLATDQHFLK